MVAHWYALLLIDSSVPWEGGSYLGHATGSSAAPYRDETIKQ